MENVPRDILNCMVDAYIRDADSFRNLSLTCKLFAGICRKNKYKSFTQYQRDKYVYENIGREAQFQKDKHSYEIVERKDKHIFGDMQHLSCDNKIITLRSINFVIKGMLTYRCEKLTRIRFDLYSNSLQHLFYCYFALDDQYMKYDYEWGKAIDNTNILNGYKYFIIRNKSRGEYLYVGEAKKTFDVKQQMPYVRNIDFKIEMTNETMGKLTCDWTSVKYIHPESDISN